MTAPFDHNQAQSALDDRAARRSSFMTCAEFFKQNLSGKKFKRVLACHCGQAAMDLNAPLPEGFAGQPEPIYADSPEGLELLRHSAAHVMAAAVKRLFPETQITIGPAIAEGFYYDFDREKAFTPDDLVAIEAEMARITAADEPFERSLMPRAGAAEFFRRQGETYKAEIIDDLPPEVATVSLYRTGDFIDLCRGPHIPSAGVLTAFKLIGLAGAYWRGDEKNPMLQRIYGTAFADAEALKKHLQRLEEARKRDHRKLGQQLDLFSFSDEAGAGMVIWHPKGALLRAILEDFERKEHLRRGYHLAQGPQLLKRELWERSGHYDHYRQNMYFTRIDERDYGVKPMNCLAHMLIYKSRVRSYRDLPIRYFELGVVHRHEKSGVLHGLLRVRQFTQDDAHILCRPDQLRQEIIGVLEFVRKVMDLFGFEYELELSTRPENSIGSDEDWERATAALAGALDSLGLPYEINAGDGAFYGPKIDVKLKDALDRRWQCATIQCDFTLPERFDLHYVAEDGARRRPVMVHRVILGAVERFIGVLVEHFAGAFPTWLAPEQARILTVTEIQADYAEQTAQALRDYGLRVEADVRNEKLGYKVREAQMEKIPYLLIVGDREVAEAGLTVRPRTGPELGFMSVELAARHIEADALEPFKKGGLSYSFSATVQTRPA